MTNIDHFAVLSSLLAGELAIMRNCSELEASLTPLTPATEVGNRDLGLDSLQLLQLASAVSQMYHLHETGVDEYLLRYRKLSNWVEIISTSLARKSDRLTFLTSGSTGRPKRCVHKTVQLQEEIETHAAPLSDIARIVSLVPRHHIYGFLWTVMLPAHLGVEVIDARLWTPAKLAQQLRETDLLVATPTTWQHLSHNIEHFPAGVRGVTSGAPCPVPLHESLRAQGLRLTEIYGSSETAGVATKTAVAAPFELLPFWNKTDSTYFIARKGSEPVELPDHLEWLDDRRFRLAGRRDSAVQILGMNAFPQRVANLIRSHALVRECSVRPMTPSEGDRLKAFVVLHNPASEPQARQDLAAWLQANLQPHERPAHILFGPSLPASDTGKAADWSI